MTPIVDRATSRRRFIQFLAASPLFAGTGLAALAAEPCPERPADPFVWAPRDYDHLIASPKEALDVFDFEPVMHKNVPPAHFGYMASGVDDDVTLRANREGFLKFQLRPRRLVDVSKVDMSTEILGQRYETPIIIDPTGGHKALSSRRRGRRRARGQDRRSPDDPVDASLDLGCRRDRRTWPADLVAALCHQQIRSRQASCREHGAARLDRHCRHRRPQRRPQPGSRAAHAPARHPRVLGLPRPFEPCRLDARRSDVRGRGSLRAEKYSVVRHVVGLPEAAARSDQAENGDQGHSRLGGCQDRRRDRHRRDHRVKSRRPRRRIRPLHHREPCRDHRRSPAPCRC